MVLPGFNEASGTSTRNRPSEPTTSKPCRPRDASYCTADADFRRGGDRRGPGGRGRRRQAGGRGPGGGDRRGPPRRRGVLVLGVHAVQVAPAALRGARRGTPDPGRGGGRHRRTGRG